MTIIIDSAYRYLYNGKELLDDLNLNLYDFGARYFDPTECRILYTLLTSFGVKIPFMPFAMAY